MQASYSGYNRSVKYLFENATEVSVEQILTTGTPIATVTVDGDDIDLYAPAGGGTTVVPNPVGTPTDDLDTIQIGNVIYNIPGGGEISNVIPEEEYKYSEINTTSQTSHTVSEDMNAIAINLSVNGEASSYTQTCTISTTGTVLDTKQNSRDTWSSPDRNYAVTVDSLKLEAQDDVEFSNIGTANYIVRFRGIIKLNTEVRLLTEVSNVVTSDNSNNSRTVQLDPDKNYMILGYNISGTGGTPGSVSISAQGGTLSEILINPSYINMKCAFVSSASSVTISFDSGTNYVSKGHIIYECRVKSSKYVTEEELDEAISELEANFQDGVDDIYDACVSKGSTPASTSLADVVQGILDIPQSGTGPTPHKYFRTRYTNLGFTLTNWVLKLSDNFEFTYKMMDSPSRNGQWPGIIGMNVNGGNLQPLQIQFNFYAGRTCMNIGYDGYWAGDGNISYNSPFDYDNYYKLKLESGTFTLLKGASFNAISTVAFTYVRPVGADTDTDTVKLLKHLLPQQAAMDIMVFGLKVWRSGNLIHNYVPESNGFHDEIDNITFPYDVSGCSYGKLYEDEDTIITI